MKNYEKYFDEKELRWKNRKCDTQGCEINYTGSITDKSTYKPSIDSIRQALANGKTIVSGLYEYDKEGKRKEDCERVWDEWEKPDLIDVDNYIKEEQNKNRKKYEEAKYKNLAKKYSEKLKEQDEENRKNVIELIHEAIEKGKK